MKPKAGGDRIARAAWIVSYLVFVGLFITFLVLYLTNRDKHSSSSSSFEGKGSYQTQDYHEVDIFSPKWSVMDLKESKEWKEPKNSCPTNPKPPKQKKFSAPSDFEDLCRQARSNFTLSRVVYGHSENPSADDRPFLTVVTRTHNRTEQLKRNMSLCAQMTDFDFEHVILHDHVGAGMQVAETALHEFRNEFRGQYICHLDDDDWLINFNLVREMKKALALLNRPLVKVIVFKVWHAPFNRELPSAWKKFPSEGQITTSNVLIHHTLYQDPANSGAVAMHHAGDYTFIHNCLKDCTADNILWVNETFFYISLERAPPSPVAVPRGKVTVALKGGLGNQMFQVAAAYAYAEAHGKDFVLKHRLQRVSEGEAVSRPTYFQNTFHWTLDSDKLDEFTWNEYVEPSFCFHPIVSHYGNVKLEGYFQSSKYFDSIRSFLARKFLEKKTVSCPGLQNRKSNQAVVSVHFRLTDYVNSTFHANQGQEYYTRALEVLQKQVGRKALTLMVFTDDVEWCQQHLPDLFSSYPEVDLSYSPSGLTDELDMALMSQCDHHIIANSSFSWWGAYLDMKPEAVTVAPSQWFNGQDPGTWETVYAPNWIRV